MILRRFMKHVTDQNWFAVSVDLIVLVVGIFLGLQVDNWNQQRIERVEEWEYMQRLLLDADNSITANEAMVVSMNQRKAGRVEFLSILDNKSFHEQDMARLSQNYLYSMRDFDNLIYFEDTMDELTSTGKLSVISSTNFKAKMARFRAQVERNERILGVLSGILADAGVRNADLLTWNITANLLITPSQELNDNIMIYRTFVAQASTLEYLHSNELYFHEQIKTFRNEIAAELERIK